MDTAGIVALVIGIAVNGAAMVFPSMYPNVPARIIRTVWWGGLSIALAGCVYIAYDFAMRRQLINPTGLVVVGVSGVVVFALVAAVGVFLQSKSDAPVAPPPQAQRDTPTPAAAPKRAWSPSEKVRLSRTVDEVTGLLGEAEELANSASRFDRENGNMSPSQMRDGLVRLLDASRILREKIFQDYVPNHQYAKFDPATLFVGDLTLRDFNQVANDFAVAIDLLADYAPPKAKEVLDAWPARTVPLAISRLRTAISASFQKVQALSAEIETR